VCVCVSILLLGGSWAAKSQTRLNTEHHPAPERSTPTAADGAADAAAAILSSTAAPACFALAGGRAVGANAASCDIERSPATSSRSIRGPSKAKSGPPVPPVSCFGVKGMRENGVARRDRKSIPIDSRMDDIEIGCRHILSVCGAVRHLLADALKAAESC
jgi:hypothetical protein